MRACRSRCRVRPNCFDFCIRISYNNDTEEIREERKEAMTRQQLNWQDWVTTAVAIAGVATAILIAIFKWLGLIPT